MREKKKFHQKVGFLEGSKVTKGFFIGKDKNELLEHLLNKNWKYLKKIRKNIY